MELNKEDIDDSLVKLHILMSKEEVDLEVNKIVKSYIIHANVKGFRKGKVPVNVIKSMYKEDIWSNASSTLVSNGLEEALREKSVQHSGNPEISEKDRSSLSKKHLGTFHLDGSFSFTVHLEPPPQLDVKDYIGLEISLKNSSKESWLKKKVVETQNMFGMKEVSRESSKMGDELIVDFSAMIDGNPVGVKEENVTFVIGEGNYLPEFESALIGRRIGEDFIADIKYPSDYNNQHLAGKIVQFNCLVKEIQVIVPHELNDELASLASYETVEELMNHFDEEWIEEYEKVIRARILDKIMVHLIPLNEFRAPKSWLDAEFQNVLARFEIKDEGLQDDMRASLMTLAEKTVKSAFILDKIYEKESSIHLTPDEIYASAEKDMHGISVSGEDIIENLKKEGKYESFITYCEQQKVVNFLIENTKIMEQN